MHDGPSPTDARVIYGVNPVRELLGARAGDVAVVYVAAGKSGGALRDLRALAKRAGVTVVDRTPAELDQLAGGGLHQGVVAVAGAFAYADLDAVLTDVAAAGRAALLVVLDGVQDPQNLGAVIRSAAALAADAVVIPQDRAAGVTPAVVKASAGATERVPVAQVVNLSRALEQMRRAGIWPVAAILDCGVAPAALDLTVPTAFVLGAEGRGLRPLVAKHCDFRVSIPMAASGIASLNVSVAAGVLLYEAQRQRAPDSAPRNPARSPP